METERTPDTSATEERKSPEELAEEVKQENPDPTTRRETFELDLMEEDLVEEGRDVQVNPDDAEA